MINEQGTMIRVESSPTFYFPTNYFPFHYPLFPIILSLDGCNTNHVDDLADAGAHLEDVDGFV